MSHINIEKGNRYWKGSVTDGVLTCRWGVEGGKEQDSHKVFTDNNRNTGNERAVIAMIQKARIKVRKGYTITGYAVPDEHVDTLEKLVGHVETKHVQKLTFISGDDIGSAESLLPAIASIKVNGISCRVEAGKLMSRSNKEFPNLIHLANKLFPIMDRLEGVQFELFNPALTLEQIVEDVANGGENIQPWLFDVMHDKPAHERASYVVDLCTEFGERFGLQLPSMKPVHNLDELKLFYDHTLSLGGEGLVLHAIDSGYKFDKRPKHSVKIKPTMTEEFTIINVVCDKTGKGEHVASYEVETPGGPVKVTQLGDVEKRMKLWQDYCDGNFEPIDLPLTTSFREWTRYGKPRHITEAHIRNELLEGPANEV